MMRAPKRGQQKAKVVTIPAPMGGWNARDVISGMGKADALTLENWVVVPGGIKVRSGHVDWATGMTGAVETLMGWHPASGAAKLFGAVAADIYDVTNTGAVGASVQTGLTSGRWQHVNFATPGGHYLYAVNGQDAPRHFNGTIWTQPVITGATATTFVHVAIHAERLWFVEKGSLRVWYLPVKSIAGAATGFDVASFCRLGGEMVAIASWTRDGGAGPDDYLVGLTSKGEVLVYSGTDPAVMRLVGVFQIAEPVGRRCTIKLGGELIVLTSQGPVSLSQALGTPQAGTQNIALTSKVGGAFQDAFTEAGTAFGWQMIEHPRTGLLIVNVPRQERALQNQFVFGTQTDAWSRFTGLNAGCWGLFGGELYFGSNTGRVGKMTGYTDAGSAIIATYQHAFSVFRSPATKRATLARARMISPVAYIPAVSVRTDYDTTAPDSRIMAATTNGGPWDTSPWDTTPWGSETASTQSWQGVSGVGSAVSLGMRIAATAPVVLNSIDLAYETGGFL